MQKKSPPHLAHLPSVSLLLTTPQARQLETAYGKNLLKSTIRDVLGERRKQIKTGQDPIITPDRILSDVADRMDADNRPSLCTVFNLTGTILHTNLGRAVLPEDAIAEVARVARSASTLEYDLGTGMRGDRDNHIEKQILKITGAEAATVVNNNAAAVMLVLNSLALGKEVPVSRGELVEIGGSFRIPDIMTRSGCKLIEVGTTNRTHLKDFGSAIGPETAMIMKVHTSNYVIEGFTSEVPEKDIAALCNQHGIPFVNDLGSGTLANLEDFGLPHEPTPMDALKAGADIVMFSGDKLLGGPQAGIVVGRKDLVNRIKANPMKRALRCDKMTIAALSAVLRHYFDPQRLPDKSPVIAALTRKSEEIAKIAQILAPKVDSALGPQWNVHVTICESQIGSGALPTRTLKSAGLAITATHKTVSGSVLENLATAFRQLPIPVIGRIHDGALILDLRCLHPEDVTEFSAQLKQIEDRA